MYAVLNKCIAELESSAPAADEMLQLVDGDWKLVWSTITAPERASSPLFWAVQVNNEFRDNVKKCITIVLYQVFPLQHEARFETIV